MFEVFARPKPCRVMMTLRDRETVWHLSKLASATNTTYVFVTRLASRLAAEGFVIIESKGKRRIVRLTQKGCEIANAIEELNSRFEI